MPADLTDAEVATGPEISPSDLAERLGEPGSISVDTRGGMAYRAGHVPSSVNIRDDCLDDMLRHGSPFPAGCTIVFICPAGDYSRWLAAFLTRAGHDAASLADGIVAWRDAGLPLESSLALQP
jgi:rhodanese-related sulfurtransferase